MVDFQRDPFGVSSDRWRCVKAHGDYAFVGSEAGGGIQVFDMTDIDGGTPPNRVTLQTTVTTGGCTTATHTLAIDATSGFLYRCGGGSGVARLHARPGRLQPGESGIQGDTPRRSNDARR